MQRVSPWSEALHRAHENIERLLLVLASHLARGLSNEERDERLMLAIVRYLTEFIDRLHGPTERVAFGLLADRAPWLRALLEAHERDRDRILASGRRLSEAIEQRGPIESEGLGFVAMLRGYIAVEEAELLPALECLEAACDLGTARGAPDPEEEERFRGMFAQLSDEAGCECR